MAENGKCFTYIWKIKNFNFCFSESGIYSPYFFAHVLNGTRWSLFLHPNSLKFNNCVACYIRREVSESPDQFELNYELSFLAGDGSVQDSKIFLKKMYKRNFIDYDLALYVKRDDLFLLKKDKFIPDDTLTIRCRMWDCQNSTTLSESCYAETLIETECQSFVGTIEKFSCLEPEEKYPINIISSKESFFPSMNLCVAAENKLVIQMELINMSLKGLLFNNYNAYKCKIFIRDKCGNKMKYGHGQFHDNELHCLPLALTEKHLIENKRFYFPNDVLTIECEIIFPTGKSIEKTNEQEFVFDYLCTQEIISNATKTNFSSEVQHVVDCLDKEGVESNTRSTDVSSGEQKFENFTTLKDDLNSLFKDGVLCDTKLKTATETFPAHIAVLSARSPVFRSMFTADMKEKMNKCVDIDDLDADTVRRMLLFIYTDTMEELSEHESVKNLYFAADKYNIVPLRYRCSNFLKHNILLTDCCDILLLADKHQDNDLKKAVQDYIAENDEAVLFSEEWKNLEKDHPQLTLEIFRAVYMKNRKG